MSGSCSHVEVEGPRGDRQVVHHYRAAAGDRYVCSGIIQLEICVGTTRESGSSSASFAEKTARLKHNYGTRLCSAKWVAPRNKYKCRTTGKDDRVKAGCAEGVSRKSRAFGECGATIERDSACISRRQSMSRVRQCHRAANAPGSAGVEGNCDRIGYITIECGARGDRQISSSPTANSQGDRRGSLKSNVGRAGNRELPDRLSGHCRYGSGRAIIENESIVGGRRSACRRPICRGCPRSASGLIPGVGSLRRGRCAYDGQAERR